MAQQRQRPPRSAVPILSGLSHADRLQGAAVEVEDREQRIVRSISTDDASPGRQGHPTDGAQSVLPSLPARAECLPEPILPTVPADTGLSTNRLDVGTAVTARSPRTAVLERLQHGAAVVHRLRVDARD